VNKECHIPENFDSPGSQNFVSRFVVICVVSDKMQVLL